MCKRACLSKMVVLEEGYAQMLEVLHAMATHSGTFSDEELQQIVDKNATALDEVEVGDIKELVEG